MELEPLNTFNDPQYMGTLSSQSENTDTIFSNTKKQVKRRGYIFTFIISIHTKIHTGNKKTALTCLKLIQLELFTVCFG